MHERENGVDEVKCPVEDAHTANGDADLLLARLGFIPVVADVAAPVMQGGSPDGDKEKRADKVHQHIGHVGLVLGGAETEGGDNDQGVDEETDEHTARYDLRVGVLVLVQIPCPADAQEFTLVAHSVENQNYKINHLKQKNVNRY